MKLWLIRHGATVATLENRYSGHGDPPLAPQGRTQAQSLAALLPRGLTTWSSDLLRAQQTAELALGAIGRTSQDFRELNFGAFEGLTASECASRWAQAHAEFVAHPWESSPPQGEALSQLARRVRRGFDQMRAEANGEIALVSHAGPIKLLLLEALGLPLSSVYALHIEPASASLLELWDGGTTLRALNLLGDPR